MLEYIIKMKGNCWSSSITWKCADCPVSEVCFNSDSLETIKQEAIKILKIIKIDDIIDRALRNI